MESTEKQEIAVKIADIVVDLLRRGTLTGAAADQLAPLALRYSAKPSTPAKRIIGRKAYL